MKIKLAILDRDPGYLNRIVNVFSTKYADKFQLYSFTDIQVALSTLETTKIDVLVASDVFEIDTRQLPKRCGFAYFVESADIDTYNGQRAICKFQKADLIYKQILSIYSENAGNVSGVKVGDDNTKLIMFHSPSGGAGASTVAAACAIRLASKGLRVLYLNLESFGPSDVFFDAVGQFYMSDIIFALKSKKTNLALKLESCVRQADNGVYFYAPSKIALDMTELNYEDKSRLLSELCIAGLYDYVIVDTEFSIGKEALKLYRMAARLVWVGDGSEISNGKLSRAFEALTMLEQNADVTLTDRIHLIYNKFSNKTSQGLAGVDIKTIGGAPRYEHALSAQVVAQLCKMDMFDKLM